MSLATLIADRNAAGSRYAAALIELRAALIELAAFDFAGQNAKFNRVDPNKTFHPLPDCVPQELAHPEFAHVPGGWREAVRTRGETIIAKY